MLDFNTQQYSEEDIRHHRGQQVQRLQIVIESLEEELKSLLTRESSLKQEVTFSSKTFLYTLLSEKEQTKIREIEQLLGEIEVAKRVVQEKMQQAKVSQTLYKTTCERLLAQKQGGEPSPSNMSTQGLEKKNPQQKAPRPKLFMIK